jgi:hypothetical protein
MGMLDFQQLPDRINMTILGGINYLLCDGLDTSIKTAEAVSLVCGLTGVVAWPLGILSADMAYLANNSPNARGNNWHRASRKACPIR